MASLKETRAQHVTAARNITETAKGAGRELTADEVQFVQEQFATIETLDRTMEEQRKGDELMARIAGTGGAGLKGRRLDFSPQGRRKSAELVAARAKDRAEAFGQKAFDSSVVASIDVAAEPHPLAQPIPGFTAALTVVQHATANYRYVRQTSRTNNAAVVAAGDLKPTSDYGLIVVDQTLAVVAHLVPGIDKFILEDAASTVQLISNEMLAGIGTAVEQFVLNGDLVDDGMTGILQTSGIQSQPAVGTDLFATTRNAVTKLETVGHVPGLFVFNPVDWQRFELAKATGSGEFILDGSPVDLSARKLWGVPAVVTTAIAAGTAALLDLSAVALDTDTGGVRFESTASAGDDFDRNRIRMRAEGRYGVSVFQPLGVVKVTLPV
ncbi:MAG: phage major capsid protein [Nakamurella sp.]